MSKKFYQICIVILLIPLLFIIQNNYLKQNNYPTKIHGTFKANTDSGQNIISFDQKEMKYYRFIDSILKEKGDFKKSEIGSIYFLESDISDTYILLENNTFYFVDKLDQIIYFEKESDALTFFGEIN